MILANALSTDLGIMDAAIIAVLGYAVVFFGLILLMIVVAAMGKFFSAKKSAPAKPVEAPVAAPAAPVTPAPVAAPAAAPNGNQPAPGTAGELKLYDTPPKTAALLMAIVASKMGKPLNELRFKSIKEVKK